MKKIIFAVIMAFIFFVLLNFVYCNLDNATLAYGVVFKFNVPYLLDLKSMPIPMGFVLLLAFCFGMIALSIFEVLPSLFKTMELRSRNKRIKDLEREVDVLREVADKNDEESIKSLSDDLYLGDKK